MTALLVALCAGALGLGVAAWRTAQLVPRIRGAHPLYAYGAATMVAWQVLVRAGGAALLLLAAVPVLILAVL